MSADVTEPKSWSFSPDLRVISSETAETQFGELLGVALFDGFLLGENGAHLFQALHVAGVGLEGELARQKEIAGVALCYFHHLAASAELFDVFLQNDLHDPSPLIPSIPMRLRKAVPYAISKSKQLRTLPALKTGEMKPLIPTAPRQTGAARCSARA